MTKGKKGIASKDKVEEYVYLYSQRQGFPGKWTPEEMELITNLYKSGVTSSRWILRNVKELSHKGFHPIRHKIEVLSRQESQSSLIKSKKSSKLKSNKVRK